MISFEKYLATRIYNGFLNEEEVYDIYPQHKDEIKKLLDNWRGTEIPVVDEE